MPKSQLSVREQIGLVLGVLLFFAVVLTIAGYAASGQTREKIADFAADGATVTGTITDRYIHSVSRNWVYWLDVSFRAQDGKTYTESDEVPNSVYDSLNIGDPVQVTYVKSKPQWFYVAGNAPTERDVAISEGMFQYGLVASLLFLIALIVFIVWSRSGGTPANRNSAPDPTHDFSFRPPPPQPRTGFGTRGR
jgi:hypothetical protein